MSRYIGITAAQAREITELARRHEAGRNDLQERQRMEMQQLEESHGRSDGVANELARICESAKPSDAT